MCHLTNTAYSYAIADMLMLGIYFLLCPGEYAFTTNIDTSPFHLCDVYLLINTRRLDMIAVPEQDLNQANFVALEFTNQKNGVFGELVGLGHSGHPSWCPVQAILSRIRHLWQHNAQPTTPPYRYYDRSWRNLDTSTLMSHLRITVTPLGHLYGIKPDEISVRSLLASGAMALLCAKVDTDTICPLRSVVFWWNVKISSRPILPNPCLACLTNGKHSRLLHFNSQPYKRGIKGGSGKVETLATCIRWTALIVINKSAQQYTFLAFREDRAVGTILYVTVICEKAVKVVKERVRQKNKHYFGYEGWIVSSKYTFNSLAFFWTLPSPPGEVVR